MGALSDRYSRPSVFEIITIVAGGWSAEKVDFKRLPGFIIGVNESSVRMRCHAIVSMDRLWTENRWKEIAQKQRPSWIRDAALKCIDTDGCFWLRSFKCDYRSTVFSDHVDILNGTNSGFCALNLAFQMRPKKLYLVGFDMNLSPDGRAYWHPNHPWKSPKKAGSNLAHWATQFDHAARDFAQVGTSVFNVSLSSSIKSFAKISPDAMYNVMGTRGIHAEWPTTTAL